MKRRISSPECGGEGASRSDQTARARQQRLREQQMGFGTALPGSLPSLLQDLLPLLRSPQAAEGGEGDEHGAAVVFCDIGAGSGNILSDVQDSGVLQGQEGGQEARLWGVEMNLACASETPERWRDLISWSKLEELPARHQLRRDTTVAYMYDLCLKRLTRKARTRAGGGAGQEGCVEDPHLPIQRVLLSLDLMPALRFFISTYDPEELHLSGSDSRATRDCGGTSWRLVLQKKLPCSTDSYTFFVYERVSAAALQGTTSNSTTSRSGK